MPKQTVSSLGLGLFGAAMLCGLSSTAQAQSLTVNASGNIASTCAISVSAPFGAPNLSSDGSVSGQASVNCNTGFKLNAQSLNGAIKTTAVAPQGFVNSVTYQLGVSVPLETGGPISATCSSGSLVAGQSGCSLSPANPSGLSSGGRAALNKTAVLTASWVVPALPVRLVAGSYDDVITLTIAAVP